MKLKNTACLLTLFALPLLLAAADAESAPRITAAEFGETRFDYRLVQIDATVKEVSRDETNPDYHYFALESDGEIVYAAAPVPDARVEEARQLAGCRVTATGHIAPRLYGQRERIGRTLQLESLDGFSGVNRPTSHVPDDAIGTHGMGPANLTKTLEMGFAGRVIAVWDSTRILVARTPNPHGRDEVVRADLQAKPVPRLGDQVYVYGHPWTDLFNVNLEHARWSRDQDTNLVFRTETVTNITARDALFDDRGRRRIRYDWHGRTVRIRGVVRNTPDPHDPSARLLVDDGGLITPVVINALPEPPSDLPPGATIEATGVFVLDSEAWQPNTLLPQLRGFFVVLRTPDDIRVLKRPSWWTSGRLVALLLVLASLIVAVLVWNRVLRALVERRGRELLRSQLEADRTRLKAAERTRLAVELHDSIAQSLAGVSLELAAASVTHGAQGDEVRRHLDRASGTLKSCRDELRSCLWDLRSRALEEPDFAKAVRKTLEPQLDDTRVTVDLAIPRRRLSDSDAHALLCAIRELVVNAIRHGHADEVAVRGAADAHTAEITVSDNGCGFDPAAAPGVAECHFGLQGIRERLTALEGTLTLDSAPGRGTRATIRFSLANARTAKEDGHGE